jgi:hypothetical protein
MVTNPRHLSPMKIITWLPEQNGQRIGKGKRELTGERYRWKVDPWEFFCSLSIAIGSGIL